MAGNQTNGAIRHDAERDGQREQGNPTPGAATIQAVYRYYLTKIKWKHHGHANPDAALNKVFRVLETDLAAQRAAQSESDR